MRKKTIEEYIELIHELEEQDGQAQTGAIAEEMNITPPSVTEMLQKLEKEGYVHYKSYSGATLTEKGRRLAHRLAKRHETIAEFFEMIGVDHDQAQIDACQIEHHISERSFQHLEKYVRSMQKKAGKNADN
ncbi:MAG TPA: metal-dependent transcriptional regulator [Methanoregulaceae archaeon]|mgnify:CR=1 FL=1|jgi:Mn-dependent DtxR family transcriptional regulator|nr:metal-dependent transcriptional regulator [Methanolinea sp.]MCC7566632.1 metal-dependent transcriptional regulator [Methanoregulaceae archaeon]MDD3091831.1 metal-dependent transcriptional regulator [Methanoregulaceae archaeon]MDD5048494.1 metal-dependent transcriptional regulator [Methanoregulaceae archaeon]MDD5685522.1 metal-dependent transcriptional regulator [Methanoregulaceae archaeon]